jgi:hypothetical protein
MKLRGKAQGGAVARAARARDIEARRGAMVNPWQRGATKRLRVRGGRSRPSPWALPLWAWMLAMVLVVSACSAGGGKSGALSGDRIRVFYNNDNFSYLEPCGCRISPIGGMDRRWNGMVAYPEESRVFVDAGNMLFKSTQASEFLAPQWFEQAGGVIEAYNILKADAAAVGATDFALGVDKFLELAGKARFPFLSANLYRKDSGKLLLKDSVIISRYGKKIGIFGLFHPSLPLPPELEARDLLGTAREQVKKLRGEGADMVIALAHEGYDNDVILAREVPGIDLIVGAHSQSMLQTPDMEGNTLVVQLSNQGQLLGMVEYEASSLPKKRTDFKVDELNAEYNEAPGGRANPMKDLVAVTNLRMAEANKKLDERIWAAHQAESAAGYQSFLSCRDCHNKQANFQEGKLHAASFLTLMAKKQENNLDCVKCHSVGLGAPGGFKSMADAFRDQYDQPVPLAAVKEAMGKNFPPADADYRKNPGKIRPDVQRFIAALQKAGVRKAMPTVQCENCHGGRPGHPFNENHAASSKVATTACLACHTKEQMPSWYDAAGKLKNDVVEKAKASVTCPR